MAQKWLSGEEGRRLWMYNFKIWYRSSFYVKVECHHWKQQGKTCRRGWLSVYTRIKSDCASACRNPSWNNSPLLKHEWRYSLKLSCLMNATNHSSHPLIIDKRSWVNHVWKRWASSKSGLIASDYMARIVKGIHVRIGKFYLAALAEMYLHI